MFTRLHHVGLVVRRLEDGLALWRERLGLDVSAQGGDEAAALRLWREAGMGVVHGLTTSQAARNVLHDAGVSFGLLYEGERNAGNDVRRIGEEGLFELLVEQNMKLALELASRGTRVSWISVDTDKVLGKMTERPTRDAIPIAAQEQLIVELYSK